MITDHYAVLGLERSAGPEEIKKAYKTLAVKYHPDKNPNDPHAEEKFKRINEAYQVLSNPISKSTYDHKLEYYEAVRTQRETTTSYPGTSYHPPQRRPATRSRAYKIDKEYYRVQKILVLIFFALIASAFGLKMIREYLIELDMEAQVRFNQMMLDSAKYQFDQMHYDTALAMITHLINNNGVDYSFYIERDTMIYLVRDRAMLSFQAKNYEKAASLFQVIKKYEWSERLSTLQLLSTSYARSGRHQEAVETLSNRLSQDPDNISLLYYMALLYAKEIQEPEQAVQYLERGKMLFKKTHTEMYGSAFELLVKPENIPEMYFRIYELSSQVNMYVDDYYEAYTDCNWAIFMRQEYPELHKRRIDAGILSKQTSRVCRDINTLFSMGIKMDKSLSDKYCKNI